MTEQDEFAGGPRKLTTREECLALIAAGWSALYNGNVPQAEGAFQGARLLAKRAPNEERADLTALALCHLSVIRKRQGRTEDARRFRDEANPRLEDESPFMPLALFNYFMARALMELAEYRQAIPFWEQALVLKQEHSTPTSVADTNSS